MQEQTLHIGIDYGSKLAGTTAVAALVDGKLQIRQSQRGQDADAWLLERIRELEPKMAFIDAPLTLPAVYTLTNHTTAPDYFFRAADREVQAMSPMFIGALTARAMKLRAELAVTGVGMLETYPGALVRLLMAEVEGYKKSAAALPVFTEALQHFLTYELAAVPENWHQFDALLAWYSGYRHYKGQSVLYGDATEGRILI
jgi:predicted nuclease with RNAse H fold